MNNRPKSVEGDAQRFRVTNAVAARLSATKRVLALPVFVTTLNARISLIMARPLFLFGAYEQGRLCIHQQAQHPWVLAEMELV
jgi:hypothetical protein